MISLIKNKLLVECIRNGNNQTMEMMEMEENILNLISRGDILRFAFWFDLIQFDQISIKSPAIARLPWRASEPNSWLRLQKTDDISQKKLCNRNCCTGFIRISLHVFVV